MRQPEGSASAAPGARPESDIQRSRCHEVSATSARSAGRAVWGGGVLRVGGRGEEEGGGRGGAPAGIDAELEPVGLAERKGPVIGQQVDVEVILADRRQREAPVAPRQIDFAEIDRA